MGGRGQSADAGIALVDEETGHERHNKLNRESLYECEEQLRVMGMVIADQSVSLGGFSAGVNVRAGQPAR
jgi:hypothetical protein